MIFQSCSPLFPSAAEAVVKGQTDSILMFHQQNVLVTKLSQVSQMYNVWSLYKIY